MSTNKSPLDGINLEEIDPAKVEALAAENNITPPANVEAGSSTYTNQLLVLLLAFLGTGVISSCKKDTTKYVNVLIPGKDSIITIHDTTKEVYQIFGNDTLKSSGGHDDWVIGKSKYCLANNYIPLQGNHNNTDDLDLMSHFNVVAVDPSWYPNPNVRPCLNAEVAFGKIYLNSADQGVAAFQSALDTIENDTHDAYLKDANNQIIVVNGNAWIDVKTNPAVAALHDQFVANRINSFPKGVTITGVHDYVAQNPSAKTAVQQSITAIHALNTSGHKEIYDVNIWNFDPALMGTIFSVTPEIRTTIYGASAANQTQYRDAKDELAQIALAHMPGVATATNPHRPIFDEVLYTGNALTPQEIKDLAKNYVNPSWDNAKGTTGRKVVGQTNLSVLDLNNPNTLIDTTAMHINNDPSLGNVLFKNAPGVENDSPFGDPRDEPPPYFYTPPAGNKQEAPKTIAYPGAVMPEGVSVDYQGLVNPPSKAIKK